MCNACSSQPMRSIVAVSSITLRHNTNIITAVLNMTASNRHSKLRANLRTRTRITRRAAGFYRGDYINRVNAFAAAAEVVCGDQDDTSRHQRRATTAGSSAAIPTEPVAGAVVTSTNSVPATTYTERNDLLAMKAAFSSTGTCTSAYLASSQAASATTAAEAGVVAAALVAAEKRTALPAIITTATNSATIIEWFCDFSGQGLCRDGDFDCEITGQAVEAWAPLVTESKRAP